MTKQTIREAVVAALKTVAPEADASSLDDSERLRDALDLDSMDFLNFVIAMHKEFGVEIPETDYRKLSTLDGCIAYLKAAIQVSSP